VVVDASAVIAYLRREPGWAALEPHLAGHCLISAVNLAEVIGALRAQGLEAATVEAILAQLDLSVVAFDAPQARRAGELHLATRHLGLSLGDCACLALAAAQGLAALTTDAAWEKLDAALTVQVVS
jgi:PIN domain nuclease of toxin-antitoxin system